MILYTLIISISYVLIVLSNILLFNVKVLPSIIWTTLAVVLELAIDAVVAFVVHKIKEEKINPFKQIFTPSKAEKRFYEILGIKKWKDNIPESGKALAGFDKRSIAEPQNNVYVLKFLRETVYAGVMHFICIFLSYLPIIFCEYKLQIFLPICIVNSFLQFLPFAVQRYNRSKLLSLYKYNERKLRQNAEQEVLYGNDK